MNADLRGVAARLSLLLLLFMTIMRTCLGQNSSAIVSPIVDINPQDDIIDNIKESIGLGSDDKPFVDQWYFWLIIAILICAFIVLVFFTLRGFRRHIIARKKMEGAKLQASDAQQQLQDRKQVEKLTAEEISRRTARKIGDVRLQGVAIHIAENPLAVSNQKG